MTAALRTFALAAGCLASTVAFAQAVLWEGVKEGMSVSEVRRIFINATSSDGGKLVTGAEELLRVNRYQFAGADFVVRFFFLDRKLTQVQLARDEWAANADNRKVFDEISTQLRAKYGREKAAPFPSARAGCPRTRSGAHQGGWVSRSAWSPSPRRRRCCSSITGRSEGRMNDSLKPASGSARRPS